MEERGIMYYDGRDIHNWVLLKNSIVMNFWLSLFNRKWCMVQNYFSSTLAKDLWKGSFVLFCFLLGFAIKSFNYYNSSEIKWCEILQKFAIFVLFLLFEKLIILKNVCNFYTNLLFDILRVVIVIVYVIWRRNRI